MHRSDAYERSRSVTLPPSEGLRQEGSELRSRLALASGDAAGRAVPTRTARSFQAASPGLPTASLRERSSHSYIAYGLFVTGEHHKDSPKCN